jgi:hypothetical protein
VSLEDIARNIAYSDSLGDFDGEYNDDEQVWSSLTKKRLMRVMTEEHKIPLSWATYLLQRLDERGTVCGRPLTGLCPRTYASSSDSGSGTDRYTSQANFLQRYWNDLPTEVKSYFRDGDNAEGEWFKNKLGHLRDNKKIKDKIEENASEVTQQYILSIVAEGNERRREMKKSREQKRKEAERTK